MEIIIRGDKIEVTAAMKDYINEKLKRLEKYLENSDSVRANVVVKVKGHMQTVEITIPLHNFIIRSEETQDDFYASVDKAIDVIERQIRKNKDRLDKKYRGLPKFEMSFDFDAEEDEENTSKIVKRKDIDMKPMDEEEAIIQIELLNHDFFVFKNIDEDCVSVLYKRKDGSYGIINVK